MKRFLLFEWDRHQQLGGWDDFSESYDTLEEALSAAKHDTVFDYFHIVDSTCQEIITVSK